MAWGINVGSPSNRSYHGRVAWKSRTRRPAKRCNDTAASLGHAAAETASFARRSVSCPRLRYCDRPGNIRSSGRLNTALAASESTDIHAAPPKQGRPASQSRPRNSPAEGPSRWPRRHFLCPRSGSFAPRGKHAVLPHTWHASSGSVEGRLLRRRGLLRIRGRRRRAVLACSSAIRARALIVSSASMRSPPHLTNPMPAPCFLSVRTVRVGSDTSVIGCLASHPSVSSLLA